MRIDDLGIKQIQNGYVVSWSEKHKTPDGQGRYEFYECYDESLDGALNQIRNVLAKSEGLQKLGEAVQTAFREAGF